MLSVQDIPMTNKQWTIAFALMCGFVCGLLFSGDSDERPVAASAEASPEEAASSHGDQTAPRGTGERVSRSEEASRTEDATRDVRLVGNWRYTDTYASDGVSMAFDQFMTIEADGTMTVRDGAAAGGGGDVTWEEPASQQSYTCEWRTNGNTIEVRSEDRDWSPLAEYQVSDTNLLTVTNGDRQIWERI